MMSIETVERIPTKCVENVEQVVWQPRQPWNEVSDLDCEHKQPASE